MDAALEQSLRGQLRERQARLAEVVSEVGAAGDLVRLLHEVDRALERMDAGRFGDCLVCHEPVEEELLLSTPLARYCLCGLSDEQQRALQHDLDLASRVQAGLLPPVECRADGWDVHHRYLPAGAVSGDVLDLVAARGPAARGLHLLFGDVSGKGVAAAFLMARLDAYFRSQVELELPVQELVGRANRFLAEAPVAAQYATLVCARADADGGVELCNAGHLPPLVLRGDEVTELGAGGLPVGLFGAQRYTSHRLELEPGESLVLYTDGLTEARNKEDEEYGAARLERVLRAGAGLAPRALAAACLRDLDAFLGGAARGDDLTLLVLRRA